MISQNVLLDSVTVFNIFCCLCKVRFAKQAGPVPSLFNVFPQPEPGHCSVLLEIYQHCLPVAMAVEKLTFVGHKPLKISVALPTVVLLPAELMLPIF